MPEPPAPDQVTRLLIGYGRGDREALDRLLPQVYDELRRLAGAQMSGERPDHTLQATALVHEAFLRLVDQRSVDWRNRAQFFGLAARMMRRILVNHARDRAALKRGGAGEKLTLGAIEDWSGEPDLDLEALDDALEKLHALDERKSRVVELKFFGGLNTKEIAEVLESSTATVERDWRFAKAWLYDALAGG